MAGRIMMQVSGRIRPLHFTSSGPSLTTANAPGWRGLPLEVQPIGDWDGDERVGPLQGILGLLVYLSGQVEFTYRTEHGDHTRTSQAGDVTLVSGDHCPRLLSSRGAATVAALDLSSTWVTAATGAEYAALRSTPSISLGPQASIMKHLRPLLAHLEAPGPFDPLQVESVSLELLTALFELLPSVRSQSKTASGLAPDTCKRLQQYVHKNLGQAITHGELAKLSGHSPRHFSTIFKNSFDTTPYQYVLNARLVEASRLMRERNQHLADIAYEVGFSSQSHLSSAFHRAFGTSPRNYARRWRPTCKL